MPQPVLHPSHSALGTTVLLQCRLCAVIVPLLLRDSGDNAATLSELRATLIVEDWVHDCRASRHKAAVPVKTLQYGRLRLVGMRPFQTSDNIQDRSLLHA